MLALAVSCDCCGRNRSADPSDGSLGERIGLRERIAVKMRRSDPAIQKK